jgi:alpha-mannosidase
MELVAQRVERYLTDLSPFLTREESAPAEVRAFQGDVPAAREPTFDDSAWPLIGPDTPWREPLGSTWWLRGSFRRPANWPASETALLAQNVVKPAGGLQDVEGMLYLNGRPYHALDRYHKLVRLPDGLDEYWFAAKVWTGLIPLEPRPLPVFRLVCLDESAIQLYHDLRILHDALLTLSVEHPARRDIERLAERALRLVDWRCPGGVAFRDSIARAHELVTEHLDRWQAASYEPIITACGHAHIDCAWLWPMEQTREKTGRTFSTVLRLMDRYPEYCYMASQPLQYAMVKERFPEVFAGIKRRVREGRWEPIGGLWVEADCNMPDGESLARQLLFGTRFFEQEFGPGAQSEIVWLPDSFGFTWALPTLMRAAGLERFVTSKLSWNQTNRFPYDTFRWRGPDGSEVLAHMLCMPPVNSVPFGATYNADILPRTVTGAWARFHEKLHSRELLAAFGWGDGGGGPTEDMLEAARRLRNLPGFPRVRLGTAREFFERVERDLAESGLTLDDLPVWDGELYLEIHRGTFTSQAAQKRRNAEGQRLYHAAELFASMARALLGMPYPQAELEEGWRLILSNQFHDILPGSAIGQVYEDAAQDHERIVELGEQALGVALDAIAGVVQSPSDSLVVFNPSPYPSASYLEVPCEGLAPGDDNSQPLPAQRTADGNVLAYVEGVPANGYRAFPLAPVEEPTGRTSEEPREIGMSARHIDTPYLRIELDGAGRITRLWDKQSERDMVPPGTPANRLVLFEDKPLRWEAWDVEPFFSAKPTEVDLLTSTEELEDTEAKQLKDLETARVLESGPERGVLLLRWRSNETLVTQRLVVYARSRRIDFVTDVDWHERQMLLKVAFPTTIRSRRATYEIQFGSIERPTHRNTSWEQAAFEVPGQRWVDLSDAHGGVALLADCKHGYSAEDDTLWLSLLRSPIWPDPSADRGRHRFTYSVLPHGPGLGEVRRAAYDLTRPVLWRRVQGNRDGTLPRCFSLASCDPEAAVVETIKRAEDDDDSLIVRLYEAAGGARRTELLFGVVPEAVEQVSLLERNPKPIPGAETLGADTNGRATIRLALRPHEVKTLRLRLQRGSGRRA